MIRKLHAIAWKSIHATTFVGKFAQRAKSRAMKEAWFKRLVGLIKKDGRSYRDISLSAELGENFVQQLVNSGRDPTMGKLGQLCDELGPGTDVYVITGLWMTPQEIEFFRIATNLDPEAKRDALALLRHLKDKTSEPTPQHDELAEGLPKADIIR